MKTYHIIYTAKNGQVKSIYKAFPNFPAVENWLRSIGATYWEIG